MSLPHGFADVVDGGRPNTYGNELPQIGQFDQANRARPEYNTGTALTGVQVGEGVYATQEEIAQLMALKWNGNQREVIIPNLYKTDGEYDGVAARNFSYEMIGLLSTPGPDGVTPMGVAGVAAFTGKAAAQNVPQQAVAVFEAPCFEGERQRYMADTARLRDAIKVEESDDPCGSCKSKQVTFVREQRRSADEPMTTIYTCHSCKNTWRVG